MQKQERGKLLNRSQLGLAMYIGCTSIATVARRSRQIKKRDAPLKVSADRCKRRERHGACRPLRALGVSHSKRLLRKSYTLLRVAYSFRIKMFA